MTDLERIARVLGPAGLRVLADDLESLFGWGEVTVTIQAGRWQFSRAARTTKAPGPDQVTLEDGVS